MRWEQHGLDDTPEELRFWLARAEWFIGQEGNGTEYMWSRGYPCSLRHADSFVFLFFRCLSNASSTDRLKSTRWLTMVRLSVSFFPQELPSHFLICFKRSCLVKALFISTSLWLSSLVTFHILHSTSVYITSGCISPTPFLHTPLLFN